MKRKLTALAVLCALAQTASAQANVTVYGVFDTAIRHATNVNAAGDSQLSLTSGLIQGSRLGFRGVEDLGGGLKTIFDLQAGFNPVTGTSAQQGQLFSRQAWVGLDGAFGKLTLGRQFGVAFDALGAADPYGIGNGAQIAALQYDMVGARFNNTLKYTKKFGELGVNLAYSFGEVAGDNETGRTIGIGLDYVSNPFSVHSALQQSSDVAERKSRVFVLGGTYVVGDTKLYAAYARNKRDRGFATCANNNATTLGASVPAACVSSSNPNGINGPLSNTNLAPGSAIGDGTTNFYLLGVQYNLTPAWQFVGGYMQNNTDITGAPEARHRTFYAVADYYLSKRTDVYFSVDRNIARGFTGGYNSIANGNRPTTGVMLGMRHRF